ncbi:hypothetical protein AX14_012717, partial [Amanita brunnescens Koide BX004]
ESAKAALVAAARKELAYLERFGRPLLPFQRERREAYRYKEQSPSDHIKNLERYLLIPSNVIVSTSSYSNQFKIVGLLDWQHASILPTFLLAGIPGRLHNYDDPISQALIPPSPPANMDELDESEQSHAMGLYHRRLVHFHYVKNTEEYNKLHHDALSDPVSMFIYHLFDQAGAPWEDETHALKTTLIEATEAYYGGIGCVVSDRVWARGHTRDEGAGRKAASMIGFETETWVSNKHHATAVALAELLKLRVLTEIPEEEVRAKIEANWFLNDMDEKDYM